LNDNDAEIRAVRAQQLLDDEVLQEALRALEAHALQTALRAKTYDPHEAVSAISHLKAAHAIRSQLESLITTGKLQGRKPVQVA
jgi:hypothetical protein